jgi:hypothetical protein
MSYWMLDSNGSYDSPSLGHIDCNFLIPVHFCRCVHIFATQGLRPATSFTPMTALTGFTSALFSLAENDIIIIEIIQLMTVYGNQEITVNVTKGRRMFIFAIRCDIGFVIWL